MSKSFYNVGRKLYNLYVILIFIKEKYLYTNVMARTKASVGAKVSSGKSSKARCSAAPPPASFGTTGGGERSSRSHSGGNPVCPRETPIWQRPITSFIVTNKQPESAAEDDCVDTPRSSKPKDSRIKANENVSDDTESENEQIVRIKPRRNKIESDDEDVPKNRELDESIVLEPLTGEDSHKIDEYYQKNNKGKGRGKKTSRNVNTEARRNLKRDLEDIAFGEESEHINKKPKVE